MIMNKKIQKKNPNKLLGVVSATKFLKNEKIKFDDEVHKHKCYSLCSNC